MFAVFHGGPLDGVITEVGDNVREVGANEDVDGEEVITVYQRTGRLVETASLMAWEFVPEWDFEKAPAQNAI